MLQVRYKRYDEKPGNVLNVRTLRRDLLCRTEFDGNGGTLSYLLKDYVFNKAYGEFPDAEKEGFIVGRWEDQNGQTVDTSSKAMENKTLKPVWYDPIDYFRIESFQDGSTFTMKTWQTPIATTLEISNDKTEWRTWDYSETLTLNNGDVVFMRAPEDSPNDSAFGQATGGNYYTIATGNLKLSGKLCTLMKKDGEVSEIPQCGFINFFKGQTAITDVGSLVILADTLAQDSLKGLFYGTSITMPPVIMVNNLGGWCMKEMFRNCVNLEYAPSLDYMNLAEYCYEYMFAGCTSLTQAPRLPATNLADGCYKDMFNNCASLTEAPELPAETLPYRAYCGMLAGTSITEINLPATTLGSQAYGWMFSGCKELTSITVAFTEWSDATNQWVQNITRTDGVFKCPQDLADERGASRIPTGWTKLNIYYYQDTLTTDSVLVFENCSLNELKESDATAYFYGTAVSYPGTVSGRFIKNTDNGFTIQYQKKDDKYIKCVIVEYSEEDGNVYAKMVNRCYITAGTHTVDEDITTLNPNYDMGYNYNVSDIRFVQ